MIPGLKVIHNVINTGPDQPYGEKCPYALFHGPYYEY